MRRPVLILLCVFLVVGMTHTGQAQTNDHLKCYKVKGDLKVKGTVDITTPQFGLEPGCKISKAKFFCAPATKSNVQVVDKEKQPITPLPFSAPPAPGDRICWQVKCPEPFPSDQVVTDQFGTQTLTKFKTKFLCTPAVKGTEFCGDGTVNGSEECDGGDDTACPEQCQSDCTCPLVCPTCPEFPATGQMTCWATGGSLVTCAGTGHDGEIQAGAALSYVDPNDGTITDLNTGLMWEKKSDDGSIHDWNTTYTWDNAFAVHVATLNDANAPFAGHTDWRVPNIKELVSILDFERFDPCVNPVFNTACAPSCTVTTCSCTVSDPGAYWSSTTLAIGPHAAWLTGFTNGDVAGFVKTGSFFVRAVRGGL